MTYDERMKELLDDIDRDECVAQSEYLLWLRCWKDLIANRIETETTPHLGSDQ